MRIERVEAEVFRAPTPRPVATSFGVMRDRPAVFVKLTDADGAFGWGEIFANWPAAGAEHRARLLIEDVADLLFGEAFAAPAELRARLEPATRIRAIQCGEPGPFAQVLAGLDAALHDLAARRAGAPLARFLRADAPASVPVYASGVAIGSAEAAVAEARARGVRAFKVKIGFDAAADRAALARLGAGLGAGERLFADANQAWGPPEARAFVEAAGDLPLGWLEEPLAADAPKAAWAALAATSPVPLAAGENMLGEAAFAAATRSGAFGFLQPDVAKWGGVSGCLAVARAALAAGLTYCPHFLGGGIGLIASAHLLAAAGGDGLLELDVNENPLRDAFFAGDPGPGGRFPLADAPGLGVETPPEALAPYRTLRAETRRP